MIDPLSAIVSLLQPKMVRSKIVTGAGTWGLLGAFEDAPLFCCVVLEGKLRYTVNGTSIFVDAGDFVLIPSMSNFTVTSFELPADHQWKSEPTLLENGEYRNGTLDADADVRALISFCNLTSHDAKLLLTLLPKLLHIRGDSRLTTLIQLLIDESRAQRPARGIVLERLLEVMLIEALRSSANVTSTPGLLRGLADSRLANAIRRMHENPELSWSIALLAKEAAMSRSSFFKRFSEALGVTPMDYLMFWRMTLAKNYLEQKKSIAEVAELIGYSSASTFTVGFTRHTGVTPGQYSKAGRTPDNRHDRL